MKLRLAGLALTREPERQSRDEPLARRAAAAGELHQLLAAGGHAVLQRPLDAPRRDPELPGDLAPAVTVAVQRDDLPLRLRQRVQCRARQSHYLRLVLALEHHLLRRRRDTGPARELGCGGVGRQLAVDAVAAPQVAQLAVGRDPQPRVDLALRLAEAMLAGQHARFLEGVVHLVAGDARVPRGHLPTQRPTKPAGRRSARSARSSGCAQPAVRSSPSLPLKRTATKNWPPSRPDPARRQLVRRRQSPPYDDLSPARERRRGSDEPRRLPRGPYRRPMGTGHRAGPRVRRRRAAALELVAPALLPCPAPAHRWPPLHLTCAVAGELIRAPSADQAATTDLVCLTKEPCPRAYTPRRRHSPLDGNPKLLNRRPACPRRS